MYGRCDPCSEREPGIGRLRRTIPGRLYPRNGTSAVDHVHSPAFGHKSTQCTGWQPCLAIARVKVQSDSGADRRPPEEWCRDCDGRPGYPKRNRRPSKMATDGCGAVVFPCSAPQGHGQRSPRKVTPAAQPARATVSSLILSQWTLMVCAVMDGQEARWLPIAR